MLLEIFEELQLSIAGFLTDPSDCGALCIAAPRLGLLALRTLPQYKEVLVSVAMRLATGELLKIDEALLRRYLSDERMTLEGCTWLTATAEKAGSPHRIIVLAETHADLQAWLVRTRASPWHVSDVIVRAGPDRDGKIFIYQGEDGEERLVRVQWPDGGVAHFEGERHEERKVRVNWPDGDVQYFEGERGEERKVRREEPDGCVVHYEGERLEERKVRLNWPDGFVQFFEGEEMGEEREVRREEPDGRIVHYEGECDEERIVRVNKSDGTVQFFEGEQGEERMVRSEEPDGRVVHYEGERDEERIVRRVNGSDGTVQFFKGEERKFGEVLPDGTAMGPLPQCLMGPLPLRTLPDGLSLEAIEATKARRLLLRTRLEAELVVLRAQMQMAGLALD